jgi:hypothetical protein
MSQAEIETYLIIATIIFIAGVAIGYSSCVLFHFKDENQEN